MIYQPNFGIITDCRRTGATLDQAKAAIRGTAYAGLSLIALKKGDQFLAAKLLAQADEHNTRSQIRNVARRLLKASARP
jgi:hypothetical protein